MSHSLAQSMQTLEESLLHEDFVGREEQLDALLAQDLLEIDARGRTSDRDSIRRWLLHKDPQSRWQLSELQVRELSATLRLVLYAARQVQPPKPDSAGARHSSLWRFDAALGSWQLCFHQASKLAR